MFGYSKMMLLVRQTFHEIIAIRLILNNMVAIIGIGIKISMEIYIDTTVLRPLN